ncbi:MAG TPA: twin-arginine translocase TatA/TatE family subunit [bacterium]|nr:twin-arginine translocase TatA/TatE family subunit [bacterium]
MGPKFWELIIVLAIVILLFGPSRLAGLGGAVGKAMREFKDATKPEEPKATSTDHPGGAGTTKA